MPNWIEFRLAVQGLLRLARFSPDFTRFFDRSARGALRSFWLMALIYPFYLLQLWNPELIGQVESVPEFYLAMSVGFVVRWLVPPLLIASLAPMIGRDAEMPGGITIYNWANLLGVAVSLPLLLIDLAGVSAETLAIFYNVVLLVTLVWEAFLLTHVLRIPLWQAAIATAGDHFISNWVLLSIFLALGGVR
jgi:hypothetical protein